MAYNDWNAALYDQKHAFVAEYGKSLVSQLEPRPGETILDLGCGTGHLTSTIAATGAYVTGIDSSATMIETARKAYPDIKFLVADARSFSFPSPFDAIFSNAVLHWVPEAEQVVSCIAAALKPGGRFVAEFGGKGNVATIVTAVQQAVQELFHKEVDAGWYYPSIGEYTPLLERYELYVKSAVLFDRPTPLEDGSRGLRNWLQMFGARLLDSFSPEEVEQIVARVEEKARPQLFKGDYWIADYKRLRIFAYKGG